MSSGIHSHVTVLILIVGSGFLLNLLDPFSSFGRIFSGAYSICSALCGMDITDVIPAGF